MAGPYTIATPIGLFGSDGICDLPKKLTAIRLRWPVVIVCSYLLVLSDSSSSRFGVLYGFVFLYLASNVGLYFIRETLFDSDYFYTALVAFDTLFVTACLIITGKITTDFYLAYFLIIIVASVCQDLRGLLLVAILAPLLYGYILLQSRHAYDSAVYLRIPFLFIISLFYGYFTQLVRADVTKQKTAQKRIEQHVDRQAALYEINAAMTTTLDMRKAVNALLEKIEPFLPPGACSGITLLSKNSERTQVLGCRNLDENEWKTLFDAGWPYYTRVLVRSRAPLVVENLQADLQVKARDLFARHGLTTCLGLPLLFEGEVQGILTLCTRESYRFEDDEIRFFSTLAGHAAVAIRNSQLYEQALTANQAKEQFLSVMSHELRTPLHVITGYTGIIREGVFGRLSPQQQQVLEKIQAQSSDLLAMINSVLYAGALDARDVQLESWEVDLRNFFDEVRADYQSPRDKDLSLNWDYPFDLPAVVTDYNKLKLVVKSLVDNAIKFTDKGTVTISARYDGKERVLQLKVSDTGIGIAKSEQPYIFDKFRQVDSSQTRVYGGLGLGLYLVKGFTDILGGTIEVASEPGIGSTFSVRIPC